MKGELGGGGGGGVLVLPEMHTSYSDVQTIIYKHIVNITT